MTEGESAFEPALSLTYVDLHSQKPTSKFSSNIITKCIIKQTNVKNAEIPE